MGLRIYDEVIVLGRRMRGVIEVIAGHDPDAARQCRRALMSIALNIAEGSQQRGRLGRFRMQTAMGSADEVRACLQMSEALGYVDGVADLVDAFDKVARTLFKLMR